VKKAKKYLGQNFLKPGKYINSVVSSANISEAGIVLEIGPGKGALTELLLEKAKTVIAVEKDADLIPVLSEKFKLEIENKKLSLLEDDILSFDLNKLPKNYKLVANIPFYITGAILEKFLESDNQPSILSLIVQKEVAERIVVRDGKQSILSVSVNVFGAPKMISKIPKRYFSPEPKVDSAILLIENIKNPFKNKEELSFFFKIVKTGFSQKRKTLINNLQNLGLDKSLLVDSFKKLNLSENIRAEKLSIDNWFNLLNLLYPHIK
jgi:16S rRNA (adenine1518-N6/adenine1519-N6)-dimethyltransferase